MTQVAFRRVNGRIIPIVVGGGGGAHTPHKVNKAEKTIKRADAAMTATFAGAGLGASTYGVLKNQAARFHTRATRLFGIAAKYGKRVDPAIPQGISKKGRKIAADMFETAAFKRKAAFFAAGQRKSVKFAELGMKSRKVGRFLAKAALPTAIGLGIAAGVTTYLARRYEDK
jgi:hypothetical protein